MRSGRMMESHELPAESRSIEEAPADRERSYPLAGIAALGAVILLGVALVFLNSLLDSQVTVASTIIDDGWTGVGKGAPEESSGIPPARTVLSRLKLLDTVYTTDSVYLEVNLTKQNVTVHHRSGRASSFLISSGNPYIREGMSTPTGVFTVQNQTPMAISRQFNNARLHHWIGVQGGIGFHGLDGSGYYHHLGVRPSSHGCIRMAREAIRDMYKLVHPGALIMVHYGKPARVVAFCDPADTAGATLIDSANVFNRNLGRERLRSLYEGRAWTDPQPRLVHLARQRVRWGLEIGESDKIPKQEVPPSFSLAKASMLLPRAQGDRATSGRSSEWYLAASRAADSIVSRQQHAWDKEKEPDYRE